MSENDVAVAPAAAPGGAATVSAAPATCQGDKNEFAWELSKENVQPLKRGRDARRIQRVFGGEGDAGHRQHATLDAVISLCACLCLFGRARTNDRPSDPPTTPPLGPVAGTRSLATAREEKEAEYEAAVKPEALDGAEDPLATWCKYLAWVREEFPSNSSKAVAIMERCTRALQNATRFHNDERLIKVWIAYADEMSNPDDIFKFLHKNQIGAWRTVMVGWWEWL